MATVDVQTNELLFGSAVYTWPALAAGDDGQPVGTQGSGDRTVVINGTFGAGGTCIVEGTLDMSNWYALRDPTGASLSFTSAGLKAIMENVLAIRPRVTAGDVSTSLKAIIMVRQPRNG